MWATEPLSLHSSICPALTLHNKPSGRTVTSLLKIRKMEARRLSDLPSTTQLVSDGARIQPQS